MNFTERDRLSYYKALQNQKITLSGSQQTDYVYLVGKYGAASVEAMNTGSTKYAIARGTL